MIDDTALLPRHALHNLDQPQLQPRANLVQPDSALRALLVVPPNIVVRERDSVRVVPRHTLGDWSGRLTGLPDEGERISLRLVPLRDLWRVAARDAKTLAALALWEGLKREGKL